MDYKSSVASLNREKIEGAVPVDKEIKELNDKIWDMRKQFETLGFFKKKERKALESALAEAENSLGKAEKEREKQKAELISSIDDKISILRKKYEEQSKSLSEMILSLQEKVPEMIFKESEDPSPRPLNSTEKKLYDEKMVYDILKRTGETTAEALRNEEELSDFSIQRIVHLLSNLRKKGCVGREYIRMTAYFKVISEYKS